MYDNGYLASDKQVKFIFSLLSERKLPTEELRDEYTNEVSDGVSKQRASSIIKWLLTLPRQEASGPSRGNPDPVTETGVYGHEGEVYRVVESKQGRLYAKKLISIGPKWKFTYAPSAITFLQAKNRMTERDAAAFGRRTGSCMICARTLTNPSSIEAGIGPVCRGQV